MPFFSNSNPPLRKMQQLIRFLLVLFATFLVGIAPVEAFSFDSILSKPFSSYPSVVCSELKANYTKLKIPMNCSGNEAVSAVDYFTTGQLYLSRQKGGLGSSFAELVQKTGKNPTVGQAADFFGQISPNQFPDISIRSMANMDVTKIPLFAQQAKVAGIEPGTTLASAMQNKIFGSTPLKVDPNDGTRLENALPNGIFTRMDPRTITSVDQMAIRHLQSFGVPEMSLVKMGITVPAGGMGQFKFDRALGTPKKDKPEAMILRNVITGTYSSGGASVPASLACGARSCPHVEDNTGKVAMEGSFQGPDGFGFLCQIVPCQGPPGFNSVGLTPQFQLKNIDQKSEKADIAVSFRFCATLFSEFSCGPANLPVPGGITFAKVGRGDTIPYMIPGGLNVSSANPVRQRSTTTFQSTPTTPSNDRVPTPTVVTRTNGQTGEASQIRVENDGGYEKMGVERVKCAADYYCLKINDLGKLQAFLKNMGVELAYPFKEGDYMKEFSNNYNIVDREKYLAYLNQFDLQDPNSLQGALPGGKVVCGSKCAESFYTPSQISVRPGGVKLDFVNPLMGVGNSRVVLQPGGSYGACRDGCARKHAGVDHQTVANDIQRSSTRTTGAKAYAAEGGLVTEHSFPRGGSTSVLAIDHGNGTKTRYVHCVKPLVDLKDVVARGQPIAFEGGAGVHTGAHMHFEVYRNGSTVNPLFFKYTPSLTG